MSKKPMSDETALIRMAIKEVLDKATEPLTSVDIASAQAVRSLGVLSDRVARELKAVHQKAAQDFPLRRIPAGGNGKAKWEYYNPKVVKLAYTPKPTVTPVVPRPEPVNTVNPPVFGFNPVELEERAVETAPVTVPPTARHVKITVAGVTIEIKIEGEP